MRALTENCHRRYHTEVARKFKLRSEAATNRVKSENQTQYQLQRRGFVKKLSAIVAWLPLPFQWIFWEF